MTFSSYSSGTASINIKIPVRTTSLKIRQIILDLPATSLLSLFNEDGFEDVELVGHTSNIYSDSSTTMSTKEDNCTLENKPSLIAAAIRLSTCLGSTRISSLASGSASIIRDSSIAVPNINRSNHLFKWNQSAKVKEGQSIPGFNDGKEDMVNLGVPVTEVKSIILESPARCLLPHRPRLHV
jgi:hypothetical protein